MSNKKSLLILLGIIIVFLLLPRPTHCNSDDEFKSCSGSTNALEDIIEGNVK